MKQKILTEQLTHTFSLGSDSERIALKGVDLEISRGEFLVILGHNGSGKSTFAKHLNALFLPTGGRVYVDGLNTLEEKNLWSIRRKAGMVFQNPDNQIVATVVEEDIAFGPENLGLDPQEIRTRVDEALKLVAMEEYKQRAPHLLSGGQKQRVAIAGIIAMRPDYLILDEPTAMLDPQGRREVIDTLKRLNKKEGLTIVLITHFVEEAIFADRVIVMREGRVVLQGAPQQILSQVEVLQKLQLDVPEMAKLAYLLRKEGLQLPQGILTVEDMVDQLCQLR